MTPAEKQSLLDSYAEAEASCNLEGLHPELSSNYQDVKRRVLSGELSPDDAVAAVMAAYQPVIAA